LQQFARIFTNVAVAKNRITRHQQIGPSSNNVIHRGQINPAVDFYPERKTASLANLR
jgi:hypothetical protein